MALEPLEPTGYDLLPTPDVGQRVVRLKLRQDFIRATSTFTRGMTVAAFIGQTNVQAASVLTDGYGEYVLTAPGPAMGGGYLTYDFAKPVTSAALNDLTPWSDKTIWDPDFEWPAVLRYLMAVTGKATELTESGTSVTGATTTRNSNTRSKVLILDRYELVPQSRLPTQVRIRRYLTPSLITGLVAERPQPTVVRYSYLGMANSMLCLHDEVIVPELLQNASRITNFGTRSGIERASSGQLIPRTNFLTWLPHTFRIEQSDQPRDGLYETVVYEALPPAMPKAHQLIG
jgi:hypothetical protein